MRFTSQTRQHEALIITVINYLVTLHDAEASHTPIRHAESFDDHPTLIRYTTVVQCADTATESAIGPISSLSVDTLDLEHLFDGGQQLQRG